MKKIAILSFMLINFFLVQAQTLNVMTFNIRYSTLADSANAWLYRDDKVASQILFHETDIIGVQEALHVQIMICKKLCLILNMQVLVEQMASRKENIPPFFITLKNYNCWNQKLFGSQKLQQLLAVKAGMPPLPGL